MRRDLPLGVEDRRHGYLAKVEEATCREVRTLEVARVRRAVVEARAAARRSTTTFPLSGPLALLPPGLPGRDLVRALHGHTLAAGALRRARLAQWRDLPASARGGGAAGPAPSRRAPPSRQARLLADHRRCLAGRCERGGEKVARTPLGRPGSRFHLAVDRHGSPLEVRLAAGNENE